MKSSGKDTTFRFKHFEVENRLSAMKVGTDGILLGAWALSNFRHTIISEPKDILDVGTGTGVIALIMAQRFPNAIIAGIDIDQNSVIEAKNNFSKSPWSKRLSVDEIDFAEYCAENNSGFHSFDVIISNPPFFANGDSACNTSRWDARHEGSLSPIALVRNAAGLLNDNGRLCMVSTADNSSDIEFEVILNGMAMERKTFVITGEGKSASRILWQIAKKGICTENPIIDTLTIRDTKGAPTDEYRQLVEPFYLYVK